MCIYSATLHALCFCVMRVLFIEGGMSAATDVLMSKQHCLAA